MIWSRLLHVSLQKLLKSLQRHSIVSLQSLTWCRAKQDGSKYDLRCGLQGNVNKVRVRELKAFLQSHSVETQSILEESELKCIKHCCDM